MARSAEIHFTQRVGWLRASMLGANDGIVSTASLIVGVTAAEASRSNILVAGVAGLVAGAMSMAAGEEGEHAELAAIYVARGLDTEPANQVARSISTKSARLFVETGSGL